MRPGNMRPGNTSGKYAIFSQSGPWFNIKMSSYQYRKSHCGDKTVVRSSYLHNGISYAGKMSSLYWIRALMIWIWRQFTTEHGAAVRYWCINSFHVIHMQFSPCNWLIYNETMHCLPYICRSSFVILHNEIRDRSMAIQNECHNLSASFPRSFA